MARPKKTPCEFFLAKLLYHATAEQFTLETGEAATAAALNRRFPQQTVRTEGGPWNRYRSGERLTRSAVQGEAPLIKAVAAAYPSVMVWLRKPLWTLADLVQLSLPEVHGLMFDMPEELTVGMVGRVGSGDYIRWDSNTADLVEALLKHNTIDALGGAVALLREADLLQHGGAHAAAYEGMCSLSATLHDHAATRPFADEFAEYLRRSFKHMWWIAPGVYAERPGLAHARNPRADAKRGSA